MKYVILHADGIADHSRQELDGRTPLQASSTPCLDRLAQTGDGFADREITGQIKNYDVISASFL